MMVTVCRNFLVGEDDSLQRVSTARLDRLEGRINKKKWETGMRLGLELLPPLLNEEHSKQLINARHRVAKRRYENEFRWKRGRKIKEAIVSALFKSTVTKL